MTSATVVNFQQDSAAHRVMRIDVAGFRLRVVWHGELLARLAFEPAVEDSAECDSGAGQILGDEEAGHRSASGAGSVAVYRSLCDQLERLLAGEPVGFGDIEVDLGWATPFQRRVLLACRRIAWGSVATYKELACEVGVPRAARAVGNVMRANRCPLVIPCHRVVPSSGGLGGFSAPGGVQLKQRLLEMEGSLARARL